MTRQNLAPFLQALAAAALFGMSAPLSKLFLGEVAPVALAAFLYLGSGLGLLLIKVGQRLGRTAVATETPIGKEDIPWLAGAILAGGIAAPIVLLFSLRETAAATASLLLNFEGVATTLIAALAFREAVTRRAWLAILAITGATILLSYAPGSSWGFSLGAVGILLACVLWGIDNNFTRNISAKDPLTIVIVKGLVAGLFSLLLALLLGNSFPGLGIILGALLLGGLSYGLSITLFIRAMRHLGAARTSALFSTAPVAGVLLSLLLFSETPSFLFLLALPLMIIGAIYLVNEEHSHYHVHEAVFHEHWHDHDDDHHMHTHDGESANTSHAHPHEHAENSHEHHHLPDITHRHTHDD
ncbi:DMT family transporter [Candidatus Leptofilum sp.]|uniref:DMT family transporter n=1 Tax=Candidatus Leptofilum sp. TaxID=3241576 RepID=UPI003B58C504